MDYLRPYKVTSKKYEDANDAYEMILFFSGMIRAEACRNPVVMTGGIGIEHPEGLVENPEDIARQILGFQMENGIDIPRSRRVYCLIYTFSDDGGYRYSEDMMGKIADAIVSIYAGFQSAYAVCRMVEGYKMFLVWNNFSECGERMTKSFNPGRVYRECRNITENGTQ